MILHLAAAAMAPSWAECWVLDPVFILPPNLHLTVAQVLRDPPLGRWEEQPSSRWSSYRQCWWHFMVDTLAQSVRLSVRGFWVVPVSCAVATPPGRLEVSTAKGAPMRERELLIHNQHKRPIYPPVLHGNILHMTLTNTWINSHLSWSHMCWLGSKPSEWDSIRAGFPCPDLVILLWFLQLPANLWKWQIFTLKKLQLKSKNKLGNYKTRFIVCNYTVAEV